MGPISKNYTVYTLPGSGQTANAGGASSQVTMLNGFSLRSQRLAVILGAAIGGGVGGLLLLVAIILIAVFLIRRKKPYGLQNEGT